jgi:hypothetical protein
VEAEDLDRIEQTHGPSIRWQAGAVGWVCTCGSAWPCRTVQLAADVRAQHYRVLRDAQMLRDEPSAGEFWWSG